MTTTLADPGAARAHARAMEGTVVEAMPCLPPRADDLPNFEVGMTVTPCSSNPLGVKGCGEAGAIGAPPAVINGRSAAHSMSKARSIWARVAVGLYTGSGV